LVNNWNEAWVQAVRRISPRVLHDLLAFTGGQVCDYFRSLDPSAVGGPVSWAGPDPAPVWLDLAREYTERWHHQQHIRDAVGKPGLKAPRFFRPLLDTFVRALPHSFRDTGAEDGTLLVLTVTGPSGGQWGLLREGGQWALYRDVALEPSVEVCVAEEVAWRLFTKGLDRAEAEQNIKVAGDQRLGAKMLDVVSIIA
jgi:hypothetical protein